MMAILEFDLDKFEDQISYEIHHNAVAYQRILWDYSQWLRSQIKYASDETDTLAIQGAREKFWEIIEDHGVSIEY